MGHGRRHPRAASRSDLIAVSAPARTVAMSAERVPPGPWRWEKAVPGTPGAASPEARPSGEALVASDRKWLLSFDSGRGIPAVHPGVKALLARGWLLRPPVEPGAYAFDSDLNMEDDQGNGWTLLAKEAFDPTVIYAGAILWAGRPGAAANVEVLRTELFLTTSRTIMILVKFRQIAIRSLEKALSHD